MGRVHELLHRRGLRPAGNLCAERLGKGSRVVVDGELDWREWTDQEQNRREAVVLRAASSFSSARAAPQGRSEPGGRNGSPDDEADAEAVAASLAGKDDMPF
jgi:single-stranded DNA-binding protein